jgi:hypothetical protein
MGFLRYILVCWWFVCLELGRCSLCKRQAVTLMQEMEVALLFVTVQLCNCVWLKPRDRALVRCCAVVERPCVKKDAL